MRRHQITSTLFAIGLLFVTFSQAVASTDKPHTLPAYYDMPIGISVRGPIPAKPLQNDVVIVSVTDSETKLPNAYAHVTISLSMPGMSMPPNIITCHVENDQAYHGSCIFTMRGKWQMEIKAQFRSGKTYTAVRHVTIQ
jgi:YtkA-like